MTRPACITLLVQLLNCLWLSVSPSRMMAQEDHSLDNIHFYQLTTAEGLTDNYIHSMAIDKSGYLWVGSGEGLNKFNGKSVEKYFRSDYPAIESDYIRQIVCDDQNRLWILNGDGFLTIVDETRRFHNVRLEANQKRLPVRRILETSSHGILLFTRQSHLHLKDNIDFASIDSLKTSDFMAVEINNADTLYGKGFNFVEKMNPDEYLFAGTRNIYQVNYQTAQVSQIIPCTKCNPLCEWTDHSFLVFEGNTRIVKTIDPITRQETHPFDDIVDQHGLPLSRYITSIHPAFDDQYIITTKDAGLYVYTPSTHTLINHQHNAADPTTLVNNQPEFVISDSTGWVFVGATPHGISYYNRFAVIGQQLIFEDEVGHSYDGYINNLTTLDNDTYFIATASQLIVWKRSTNTSHFYTFSGMADHNEVVYDAVAHVTFDRFKHLWVITRRLGLYVMDQHFNIIHHFPTGLDEPIDLFTAPLSTVQECPDGQMWVTGARGLIMINPKTFQITTIENTALQELKGRYVYKTFYFDSSSIWICTDVLGAWQYNLRSHAITKYNTTNGLITNMVFCMAKDHTGNIFFGTGIGLQILLSNGKYLMYSDNNGLLNKRVEALLVDKTNRVWIGNDVGLACFSIADTTLHVFDERYGLSIQGFRINSYLQNSDDELFWGTERGLQYFFPNDLYRQKIGLRTTIQQIESRDIDTYITQTSSFHLAPGNNFVTFHFSTIDYSKHLHTFYQYQLTGIDPEWVNGGDQNSVRYPSLKPGSYTFKVRASNDKKNWIDAENQVTIELEANFWEKAWFKWLAVLAAGGVVASVISQFNKKQKKRTEALETESVINYFASQINMHQHLDDMLWDVAKNCISRLNLEECVIYLVDPVRNVLVQKAAYGPKTAKNQTILQPIDIPVGQGITGSVALSKKPEIINNTEKDSRYIVDDDRRLSEMAVPIIVDGRVIGVIDTENSQRNFFTSKHLSLMTTISILTANQIQRIHAEEEKQKAEIEVLQNKQKATESRLQSLRLQMNPHFLFNALNSIQQMILANEEMVATRYLSRFSKLLRSILIHSDKEMISLKEELEILNLYVELESVRFKEAFSYDIICDVDIDCDEVKIPTLLIQPFVENAIWHGLMHKEGMRNLRIEFTELDDVIQCIVEDNGIGRQKAKEMKISTGKDKKHTSKGIEVSMERLKSMQKNGGPPGSMFIHDLVDEHGHPTGTRIEINLPIQN